MSDHYATYEAEPGYRDDHPTHCPCGERKCPDTLDGEQAHFTTYTSVDGVRIHEGRLRDPLITSVTVVSWLDLLKALFKGSLTLRVEVTACREMTGAVIRLGRMTEDHVTGLIKRLDNEKVVEVTHRISQDMLSDSPELLTASYRRRLEETIREQGGTPDATTWSVENEPATEDTSAMVVFRLRAKP